MSATGMSGNRPQVSRISTRFPPLPSNTYGFTINNSAQGIFDEQLLNTRLNSLSALQASTLASRGISLPYPGFGSTVPQTVLQSLKNYPQFTSAIQPYAPLGKSWYDALQATLTKRYSHGLSVTGAYTFSKNLQWYGSPDVFNQSLGKDLVAANPPQTLHIAFEYRVQRYKGNLPVLGNKLVSYVLADWALSSAMYYQSGAYISRPLNGATNPISLWLGRGPGGAQLLKNPDGSYMNPWSVNWTDLSGVHHTTPLDINCHCFNPATTVVLNPAAWGPVPDAQWAADTSTLPFFRGPRHPMEAMNFARNFVIKEGFDIAGSHGVPEHFQSCSAPESCNGLQPDQRGCFLFDCTQRKLHCRLWHLWQFDSRRISGHAAQRPTRRPVDVLGKLRRPAGHEILLSPSQARRMVNREIRDPAEVQSCPVQARERLTAALFQ